MNKKVSALLLLAVIMNTTAPLLNAAEVSSEITSDNTSEVSSEAAGSEVSSETSEVSSETAESEVSSETSEVSSETAESEVSSEAATESEVSSEAAESETTSDVTDSEVTTEETAALGDEFYIFSPIEYDTEVTALGQEIPGGFNIDPEVNSSLKAGATIELTGTDGFAFSDLAVSMGSTEDDTTPLTEGTDYTVDGTSITLTNDIEEYSGIYVTYNVSIESGATDVLEATSDSSYMDLNDNDTFDGSDYYISEVGYMVNVTNGSVSDSRDIFFDTAIEGGDVAVSGSADKMTKNSDGTLTATADMTVENTGDYALKYSMFFDNANIMIDEDYVDSVYPGIDVDAGPYLSLYTDEVFEYTVDGQTYSSFDELEQSFTSSQDEYLNPSETVDVAIEFTADSDSLEWAIEDFGSFKSLNNHSSVLYTVDYGKNIFGAYPDETVETLVPFETMSTTTTTTTDDTDTTTTTTTDDTDTTDDSSYTPMTATGEQTLATTGSNSIQIIIVALAALVVAYAAKLKINLK